MLIALKSALWGLLISLETATVQAVDVQGLIKPHPIITVLRHYYSHFTDEEIEAQKHQRTCPMPDTNKWKSHTQTQDLLPLSRM